MKKYLVYPGYIISKSDGDPHYIRAEQLMQLYDVDPNECIVVWEDPSVKLGINKSSLISLRPRYHGDYKEWIEKMVKENG